MDPRAALNENALMKAMLLSAALLILAGPAAARTLEVKTGLRETTRTLTSKECLTQQALERAPFAGFEGEAQTCVDSVFEHTASRWRGKSVCTLGARQREVEIDVSALSPERVEGTVGSRLSGGGRVMTSQGTFTGRWLAADCGRRD